MTFTPPLSAAPGVTLGSVLDAKIPTGDPETAWLRRRQEYRVINPANRKKFTVAVVGTGLAGCGAAAALAELGFEVHAFCYQDSPRRAHSIAAQGGINAARARKVDNDSLYRFVVDTVKGGDFRGREAEAYRLGQESLRVIDHLNAVGAPFAREYGGALATRSFGGVQVSRTYYTRGQTGQQLQLSAYQQLMRQVQIGTIKLHPRTEMLDLIMEDGAARGVIVRDLSTGKIHAQPADAVILATGGYGTVYYLSTLAIGCNASAAWRAHRHGAYLGYPSLVQFHPTCLPVMTPWQSKTILMSESLRNDGRMWVPLTAGDERAPGNIPESERDYYLERKYPAYGNLSPRDISSRAGKEQIDSGHGVGPMHNATYLDLTDAIKRLGADVVWERYSNLIEMYRMAVGEDPMRTPIRIAPNTHYTMGGLWVDYNLMSNIPGLFVGGEANFSYHGANRLGANSLLSASVDGWFVLPYAVMDYLAPKLGQARPALDSPAVTQAHSRVLERTERLLSVHGTRTPTEFHKQLGSYLWEGCGLNRSDKSLKKAIAQIRTLRAEFWQDVLVTGKGVGINQTLEKAGRVADFMELAELMCIDALDRSESCGAHFRLEHQEAGEAVRDDDQWMFASAWATDAPLDFASNPELKFTRHAEPLEYSNVHVARRNYQ
ncbi:MAG: fumarate reductase/succinate dehydrogenase flavoprotein subunit [Propionibacteriaceae bacterium]|jgi:succinate dehydrogenase / fumarate reductase flavoprotein subunit|nr:fumarate reductase/succinate dehydrogenase flavoprotein subunit [Propionibacteriaceae bacterium]